MRLTAHLSLPLVSLLLLTATPLFAQNNDEPEVIEETPIEGTEAADLFFRAFWIEQSGGKNAEAEMLYRKLIKAHPNSEEAPRGYLALIRLSAAKGIAADDLLRALEKGYPKAKKEIELARLLAARLRTDFDHNYDESDTPVMRKIKTIQHGLRSSGGIHTEDRDFLADLGSVGHPMLADTLRSHASDAVYRAADVLAGQRSEEANAVLTAALRDPTVLYRMTIVDTIYKRRAYAKSLMKTLHTLWPTASRSMRARITKVWCGGTAETSPSSVQCYGYLVLALKDKNEDVRRAATNLGDGQSRKLRPRAFVEALIPLCKKQARSARPVWQWLPWQLGHAELAPALTQVLIDYPNSLTYQGEPTQAREVARRVDESVALAFARMAIGRCDKHASSAYSRSPTSRYALLAAASSAEAAGLLMAAGLDSGNSLASASAEGVHRARGNGGPLDRYLHNAAALRERAIRQWYDDDSARAQAAGSALNGLGIGADNFGAVLAAAKAHPAKGLLNAAYSQTFLAEIGPAKAAQLAPYAKRLTDFYRSAGSWAAPGQPAPEIDDSVFWKAVLPLMDPANSKDIRTIQALTRGSKRHAAVVAQWILGERGAKWAWRTPDNQSRRDNGSAILRRPEVLEALGSEPLRKRLFELAGDDRYEIGRWAIQTAIYLRDPDSIIALERGVASPFAKLRKEAVRGYGKRGAVGAAALVRLLENVKTLPDVRDEALDALTECATIKQLPFVNRRLDARPGDPEASTMWDIALELDAPGTTDRALVEVLGAGPVEFRLPAVWVLGEVSDARRIPVFRRVLRESREQLMIHRVLRTVADQYLIELGPEVLLHLRSPNNGIRQTATKAIERLKFYAEAKKLFDDEKRDE